MGNALPGPECIAGKWPRWCDCGGPEDCVLRKRQSALPGPECIAGKWPRCDCGGPEDCVLRKRQSEQFTVSKSTLEKIVHEVYQDAWQTCNNALHWDSGYDPEVAALRVIRNLEEGKYGSE